MATRKKQDTPPDHAPASDADAPDFASLADAATAPDAGGEAATALDDLAARLNEAPPPVDLSPEAFAEAEALYRPAPVRDRSSSDRSSSTTGRKRGRPARTDGGRSRSGEPRTTKTELLAENEQLRAQLEAAEARADTDKVAELAESFRMLSHVGFALLGEARGPHWRTTPQEDKTLGDSFAVAAAPHAEKIEANLPWAAPVLALVGIVGKRVAEDVRLARLRAPVAVTDGPALGTGPV